MLFLSSHISRSSLQIYKTSSVIRCGSIRLLSSHGHDKPVIPINDPPNDHLTFKPGTIDDIPVPKGCYYQDYKKRNMKYWRHLIQGVSFLVFTLWAVHSLDIIKWNFVPPMPPKEERIKSFWVPPAYYEDDDDDDDE